MRWTGFLLLISSSLSADVSGSGGWVLEERFTTGCEHRWKIVSGRWTFEDGALYGRSGPAESVSIELKKPLHNVRELEVEATLMSDRGEGVHISFAGQNFFHYSTGWTGIYGPYKDTRDCCLFPNVKTRLKLRRANGKYELFVNDELVVEKIDDRPKQRGTKVALFAVRGATIRYDNLRIR